MDKFEQFDITPLPASWYFVAFSDEIEPKSVHPFHYFGQDLVCYRGETGDVHVMGAYCPHQGAHLGYGGRVVARRSHPVRSTVVALQRRRQQREHPLR